MKGLGKRLLIGLLLICLLAATVSAAAFENCPGGCAHQAAIGAVHYDTLAEAFAAAADGSTVTLLADLAVAEPMTVSKAITLDLGGKTLSGSSDLLNIAADFTVKNGTVTTSSGTCLLVVGANLTVDKTAKIIATEDAAALILQSPEGDTTDPQTDIRWLNAHLGGHLESSGSNPTVAITSLGDTLYQVTLDKTTAITSAQGNALELHGGGKLTVNGGTYQAKQHALVLDVADEMTLEASVTGGKFLTEAAPIVVTQGKNATAPADFVTGGSYTQLPSGYIPAYCCIKENADHTYTVISAYTLTFRGNGGTGTMAPISVPCGSSVVLPACGFTGSEAMDFAGWMIGGKVYAAGDAFTPTDDVIVTAQWKNHIHTGGKATCLKKAVCTDCGKAYGNLASHKFKHIAAYAPTCDTSGMNSHDMCITCGNRFVGGVEISARAVTIPALGHTWETLEGTPATCTEEGLQTHQKCAECNALRIDGEAVEEAALVIPVSDHNLEQIDAAAATCQQPGMQTHQRCTFCDQLFYQGQAVDASLLSIPTISHVLSDWYSDETEHWKACVSCGEVFRQKGHSDSDLDGICNDCGYQLQPQQEIAPVPEESSGFNWLFLLPIVAAVGISVSLVFKKRK